LGLFQGNFFCRRLKGNFSQGKIKSFFEKTPDFNFKTEYFLGREFSKNSLLLFLKVYLSKKLLKIIKKMTYRSNNTKLDQLNVGWCS
jgi:hypothetical protein